MSKRMSESIELGKTDILRTFSRKTKRPLSGGLVYLPHVGRFRWLRGLDLNQRPLGYEPNELPGCSTPHLQSSKLDWEGQTQGLANFESA
jgi:hypothetical protein